MKVVPTVYEDISGNLAYPYQYTFAARVSIHKILSTANILLIPKFDGWILNVDARNVHISSKKCAHFNCHADHRFLIYCSKNLN